MSLQGKRILLGVGGSVSAYKAAEVARAFMKEGAVVDVIPTAAAQKFVTPLLFEALTGRAVHTDVMQMHDGTIPHIELAYAADLVVVCPATADLLSSMAHGRAHDALLATLLSVRAPLVVAPAMETRMWSHPATAANVALLEERGALFVGPVDGALASGRSGKGRLAPIDDIVEAGRAALVDDDLRGHTVVVTAGPTAEDVDPVRFLTNRSTGKMGVALAVAAARRGAQVHLVHGPMSTTVPTLSGLHVHPVRAAQQMCDVVTGLVDDGATLAILAAAVADYTPAQVAEQKIKKTATGGDLDAIPLKRTPDILATLGQARQEMQASTPVLVGFAAETQDVTHNGQKKLAKKKVDLICANDVSGTQSAFGSDDNAVIVLSVDQEPKQLPRMSKADIADAILDEAKRFLP